MTLRRIPWLINRLRVMPVAEIGLRGARAVTQVLEQARLSRGWTPAGRHRLEHVRSLFPDASIPHGYECPFALDHGELQRLRAGELEIFGKRYRLGTRPDWHRNPACGTKAPLDYGKSIDYRSKRVVGDVKVIWEPARHQHLVPLAVAYAVSGRVEYRDAAVAQIDSWVEQNPFGLGIHWCSSLEIALRGVSWTMVHSLLTLRDGERGLLGASANETALARSLYEHGYFIAHFLSRFSSANNHLIGELVGLWCLTRCFDFGAPTDRWRSLARTEIEREAELQVHPDGVACEQAIHYHLEVMEYLLFAWCVGAGAGTRLSSVVLDRVLRMAAFLRTVTPDRDLPPRIGDSDEAVVNRLDVRDEVDPYADVLAAVDAIADPAAPARTPKAFWYRYIAGSGSTPAVSTAPRRGDGPVTVFPHGGYAVMRTDEVLLVFDAGPLGYPAMAAHGHADALSFCLAWRGRWWLVDPGTYDYHGDQSYRSYFRGTSAHNTLTVNDLNQSKIGGPFLWLTRAPATLEPATSDGRTSTCGGYHDGYRDLGIRHHRTLTLDGATAELRIVDRLVQSQRTDVGVAVYFHFAPDVRMSLSGCEARGDRGDQDDRLILDLDARFDWALFRASEDPLLGWYSPALGRKEPCWTLRGRRSGAVPNDVVTTLRFQAGASAMTAAGGRK